MEYRRLNEIIATIAEECKGAIHREREREI